MSPAKIAVVAAGLVIILTGAVHQIAISALTRTVSGNTTAQVERTAGLFLSQSRLAALEFATETAGYARLDPFPRIFTLASETERRTAAHEAVNALNENQVSDAHDGRRAALVAVVGADGKVVARDLNINSLYGEDFKTAYPAVAEALNKGVANQDVWGFNQRMYRVACAPIRGGDGRIVGALVVGFEDSGPDAQKLRDAFGTEVALFLNGKVYSSSFPSSGRESNEEQELARVLFQGPELAVPAMKDRRQTSPFQVSIQGEAYQAVAAPLLGNTSHPPAGFVVLASLDQALAPVRRTASWLLLLGALSMLVAVIAVLYTARNFLQPLDKIEQGVSEIINGNHDYVFEKVSEVYEGLENGLNVMVARLLGRPEPGEGGEAMSAVSADLEGSVPNLMEPSGRTPVPKTAERKPSQQSAGATALSDSNQELAREPEDRYQRRLYDEYVHARKQTGEGVQDLSFEGFVAKLKDNEAALSKKYGARTVRFKVVIKQGQVTLKPVPIP